MIWILVAVYLREGIEILSTHATEAGAELALSRQLTIMEPTSQAWVEIRCWKVQA